jgi:DnaJ-class molecular chaperone
MGPDRHDGTGMADYDMRPDGYADWDDEEPEHDEPDEELCPECSGTGRVFAQFVTRADFAHGPLGREECCDECEGTGIVEVEP